MKIRGKGSGEGRGEMKRRCGTRSVNHQPSLDKISNETKGDQYSIFNSTKTNRITLMLPILDFEV